MSRKKWLGAILGLHLIGGVFLTPGYIRPDSVATYAWLRSIVLQGDLLFFDEWAGFGLIRDGIPLFKEVTPRGTLANHWWVGSSILAAPFYLAAHAVSPWSGSTDGFTGIYAFTLAWVAVAFGAIASATGYALARQEGAGAKLAAMAVAAIWVGTPMFWYEYRFPLGTHMAGVLIVALLVFVLSRAEKTEDGQAIEILAGLLLGLAVATRLQHFVLAPAVALHLLRSGRRWTGVAIAAACSILAFVPQGLAWTAVYGHPLGPLVSGASPIGGTWMPFASNALDESLLSSYHGLIPWAPVAVLAIAGWCLELRRRRLAATLLVAFAGEWIANGLFDRYFWGGMSFGPRRFVDLAIPMMIGIAWFLMRTRAVGAVMTALATAWSVLLALAAASGSLDLRRDVLPMELFHSVAAIDWGALPGALVGQAALVRAPAGTLLALVLVLLVGGGIVASIRSWRGGIVALSVAILVSSVAAAAAIPGTWRNAPRELQRFGIVLPAAREAGALLDARGLLSDERRFLLRRGRVGEAAETEWLVHCVERRLFELGVFRSIPPAPAAAPDQ